MNIIRAMKYPVIVVLVFILTACGKIDNYPAPNGGVYGKLVDKMSGKTLQTEQPNGFVIRLFEKGSQMQSPISFYGKPDGTFENAWVFQNDYKILPVEGAFFPVDTLTVPVGKRTEANFEVMPFLSVKDPQVSSVAGGVKASYRIARGQIGEKIVERITLVSKVPTVNNTIFDFRAFSNLTATADAALLAAPFSDEVSGLKSGTTYYVRIGVRTDNALKKYNYSEVFTVTVP